MVEDDNDGSKFELQGSSQPKTHTNMKRNNGISNQNVKRRAGPAIQHIIRCLRKLNKLKSMKVSVVAPRLAHIIITPIAHQTASAITEPSPASLPIRSFSCASRHSNDVASPLYGHTADRNQLMVMTWTMENSAAIPSPLLLLMFREITVLKMNSNKKMLLWKTPVTRHKVMKIVWRIMMLKR